LAGPAIVLGIVAVFDKPEIKTTVAAIDENGRSRANGRWCSH
jgi:hypothetical protein